MLRDDGARQRTRTTFLLVASTPSASLRLPPPPSAALRHIPPLHSSTTPDRPPRPFTPPPPSPTHRVTCTAPVSGCGQACSDATNVQSEIALDGEEYVIRGRKWWATGAGDPRCELIIFMGRVVGAPSMPSIPSADTPPSGGVGGLGGSSRGGEASRTASSSGDGRRQTMVLVPMRTAGVRVVRTLSVFGYDDAPHGHCELAFDEVRVPVTNLLHAEGAGGQAEGSIENPMGPNKPPTSQARLPTVISRSSSVRRPRTAGFLIAQARLGPGRIHHCMRAIGLAECALAALCRRTKSRRVFGQLLAQKGPTEHAIAESRLALEQARLLTYQAAHLMDTVGARRAMQSIAMIKVAAPRMALAVVDRAIQAFGGGGVCQDYSLAEAFAALRTLRLADGPDEVHLRTIGRCELAKSRL